MSLSTRALVLLFCSPALAAEYPVASAIEQGVAAFRAGNCAAALSSLAPVLRTPKPPAVALHAAAVCYARSGDPSAANPLFRQLTTLEPNAWQAWNNLGVNESDLGAEDNAIAAFRKARELAPAEPGPSMNLATLLRKRGDTREAFLVLDDAQRRRPEQNNVTTLWLQVAAQIAESAATSVSGKQYARALDDLLLVKRPLEVGASWHNLVGYVYFRLDRPGPALTHLQKALSLEPDSQDYVLDLAEFLSHYRSYDQLLQVMTVASARHPADPRIQLGLALAHILENRREDALPLLESLVKTNPAFEPAYPVLGEVYQDLGRQEEAMRVGRQLQRLNPANPKGWYIEGSALLELARRDNGDLGKAADSLSRSVELEPSFARAQFLLGRAYLEQNKATEAEATLLRVLQLDPQHGRAHYVLGRLYQQTGRSAEAREHLDAHRKLKEEDRSGDYRRLLIESVSPAARSAVR